MNLPFTAIWQATTPATTPTFPAEQDRRQLPDKVGNPKAPVATRVIDGTERLYKKTGRFDLARIQCRGRCIRSLRL